MKEKDKINTIVVFCSLQFLATIIVMYNTHAYKKGFDYNPSPNNKQESYNKKHQVKEVIPSYFENTTDINIREFVSNDGCIYKGELNGLGRAFYTHVGYKNCPNCRNILKEDVKEVLKEMKPNRSKAHFKIDSLLTTKTRNINGKQKTVREIMKVFNSY
tara:strand:- start:374 stop:850 length:477 start_codon:yes stop_codon:yes gene_type:complete